jgi:hypothetical protein
LRGLTGGLGSRAGRRNREVVVAATATIVLGGIRSDATDKGDGGNERKQIGDESRDADLFGGPVKVVSNHRAPS